MLLKLSGFDYVTDDNDDSDDRDGGGGDVDAADRRKLIADYSKNVHW